MAKQKLTPKEKSLFRQGCCVGYRKAIKQMKDLYEKGRQDALMDFLDAENAKKDIIKMVERLPF